MSESAQEAAPQGADASASHVHETSPEFKKKLKHFAVLTFGVVCVLFLVVAWSEHKMKAPAPATSPALAAADNPTNTQSGPVDVTTEVFKNIKDTRVNAPDTSDVVTTLSEKTKKVMDSLPGGDKILQAKEAIELAEMKRAARAATSRWGLKTVSLSVNPAPATPHPASQNSSFSSPPTSGEDLLSTDTQRRLLAQRLKKLSELKAEIKSGQYSPTKQSQSTAKLQQVQQQLSPRPPDIVGMTTQNQYNASVEGMMKLPIGTLIPAITQMKASSDRTGSFKALVSQDIYDVNAEYVLIPKGAELILKSIKMSTPNDALVSYVGYTVPWIILPNGKKIDTSKASGLDREGLAGLSDQLDRHLMAQFLGVAAYALVANETSYDGTGSSDTSYAGQVSAGLRDKLSPIAQKYLSLSPTNIIRSGQSINVMIEDEIYLVPWRNIYEEYL